MSGGENLHNNDVPKWQILEIPDEFRVKNEAGVRQYLQTQKALTANPDLQEVLNDIHSYLLQPTAWNKRIDAMTIDEKEIDNLLLTRYLISTGNWEDMPEHQLISPGLQLCKLLTFDAQRHEEEVVECMKLKREGLNGRDRLLEHYSYYQNGFKQWMTDLCTSSSILVDGNSIEATLEKISAISTLSVYLEGVLEMSESIITVRYLCGLHSDADSDPANWVPNMVKSLLSQLLITYNTDSKPDSYFDLDFITEKDISTVKKNRVKVLCKIFRQLLLQLPPDKLFFCILDSISKFEVSSKAKTDLIEFLKMMTDLNKHRKKRCMTKVLLTVANGTTMFDPEDNTQSIPIEHIVKVPKALRDLETKEVFSVL